MHFAPSNRAPTQRKNTDLRKGEQKMSSLCGLRSLCPFASIKWALTFAIATILLATAQCATAADKPNVIFILADDKGK